MKLLGLIAIFIWATLLTGAFGVDQVTGKTHNVETKSYYTDVNR